MTRLITIVFCLFLALPAYAQEHERELKAGLNYTTLAKPKAASMKPAEEAKGSESKPETEHSEEDVDPATRVWNKYKDLATGKAAEEEVKEKKAEIDKPEKPAKPEKPKVMTPEEAEAAEAEQEQQKSGIAAILDEWKNSKESQREMRTKTFKNPAIPGKDG